MHLAALAGQAHPVKLLSDHGADINALAFDIPMETCDLGCYFTPLFLAAKHHRWPPAPEVPSTFGQSRVVKLLLDSGADPSVQGCEERHALHHLVYNWALHTYGRPSNILEPGVREQYHETASLLVDALAHAKEPNEKPVKALESAVGLWRCPKGSSLPSHSFATRYKSTT